MNQDQAKILSQFINQVAEFACHTLTAFVDKEEIANKVQLMPSTQEKRLLNKEDIADRLGVSERMISELQTEGLPTVKIGRRVLFDFEDVLDWMKNRVVKKRRKNNLRVVK